ALAGRTHDAIKHLEDTLRLTKAKLGPDHAETLWAMSSLAFYHRKAGRLPEALQLYEEMLRLQQAKLGPDHPETLKTLEDVTYLRLRHFEKLKDAAGCRATAEMWERHKRADAESLYRA